MTESLVSPKKKKRKLSRFTKCPKLIDIYLNINISHSYYEPCLLGAKDKVWDVFLEWEIPEREEVRLAGRVNKMPELNTGDRCFLPTVNSGVFKQWSFPNFNTDNHRHSNTSFLSCFLIMQCMQSQKEPFIEVLNF